MSTNRFRVCLIEDDPIMGDSLCYRFKLESIVHDWYRDAQSALVGLKNRDYSVVISDICLPDMNGVELYSQIQASGKAVPPTIFITGFGSIEDAVHLLKCGAADYITKPFDLNALIDKVHQLRDSLYSHGHANGEPCLGISAAIRRVEDDIRRFSAHQATVLITGESGVGKEHAARQLHHYVNSTGEAPFVAINCAAVPENLLEAELFGHEKGAFTGALRVRKGLFEQAHGGILFLDEIGEMPPSMQAKLLRVVQERQVVRIGGESPIRVDVRLICATNRDLTKMVEQGTFREDLFYRINVLHIHLPPLRERPEDVLWFAKRFVANFNARASTEPHRLSPAAEHALLQYTWPGNLRELSHTIERACILADQPVLSAASFERHPNTGQDTAGEHNLREQLLIHERQVIERALALCGGQIMETAAHLGISRKNLWERMKKLDIRV